MKILITGASRGIGRAIALAAAKTGRFHHMHLTCRKSLDKLEEIREEILGIDPELLVSIGQGDLQSVDDANIIAKEMGPIDVIINNAAVSYTGPLIDMTEDMWNDTISTNISSIFYICKAFLPEMIARHSGQIINISSVWGNVGASCETIYSASKGAVNSFTKALAKELAPSGIQVNAVAFGMVDTDMNAHLTSDDIEALRDEIPTGHIMSTSEAAEAVMKVLEMPKELTGQIITVDGGWT
ncbi:3-oxoacyl-[acyl-carrier protein] reductase [Lachnospiraceae bacterium NE2001]|nr:3-oxoacyl-[acyl-carrier protein] reductase [Lachnospiraceae bacterium NE2001]